MIILAPTSKGDYIHISVQDAELADHLWTVNNHGYACRNNGSKSKDAKLLFLHRVIATLIIGRELLPGDVVDHVNGNKLDNRRENIRVVTYSQNAWNIKTPKHNTSGYKGVSRCGKKWQAIITYNGTSKNLGTTFTTPEEAAKAYNAASLLYHGPHGRLNEIVIPQVATTGENQLP